MSIPEIITLIFPYLQDCINLRQRRFCEIWDFNVSLADVNTFLMASGARLESIK